MVLPAAAAIRSARPQNLGAPPAIDVVWLNARPERTERISIRSDGGTDPKRAPCPRDGSRRLREPTSVVLGGLLGPTPPEFVTLGWLIGRLGDRSFGIILLLLALLSMIPGASIPVTVLLLVVACQMILARGGPAFTRKLAAYRFRTQRIAALIRNISPALKFLERFIRPRWATPLEGTKRAVGAVVLLLGLSMFAPIPLSNIPPALLVVLISFAYLERDGVLLSAALAGSLVLLAGFAAIAWQTMAGAAWLRGAL